MIFIHCHQCGARNVAQTAADEVHCSICGTRVHAGAALRIEEVEGLLRRVRDSVHLPPDLARDLTTRLTASLEDLRPEGLEPRVPATPPPIPPAALARSAPPAPPRIPDTPVSSGPAAPTKPAPIPSRPAQAARTPRVEAGPTVWERLGPVFSENLLFALSAFLIVAGAIYFVSTAWTTMTGAEKLLVVVGGLDVLGLILYGAGRLGNRGGALPDVERVLLVVVAYLVPVAAVPAGLLLDLSLPLGLLAGALVLGPGWIAVRSAARVSEPALHPFLPTALLTLSLLTILVPFASGWPVAYVTAGAAVLLAAMAFAGKRVVPAAGERLIPLLWSALLLAFAVLVLSGDVALDGGPLSVIGIAVAAFGAAAVMLEAHLARHGRLAGERSTPLLVAALALGVTGAAMALGNERALLAAAIFAAYAGLAGGFRLPAPATILVGLALAAVAYLKLPAPFRELAIQARDGAARELGYEPKALPLAWYGVTFVPYVAACGAAAALVLRRGLIAHARVIVLWTLVASTGLVLMSLTLMKGDFRAPAAVLGAQGTLLLVLAPFTRSRRLAFAGLVGIYIAIVCGLAHLEADAAINVGALAVSGLIAVLVSLRLMRLDRPLATGLARVLLDATSLMALLVFFVTLPVVLAPLIRGAPSLAALGTPAWADVPAYALFAALFTMLGLIYRRAEGGLIASIILCRALAGLTAGAGIEEWRSPVFAAASALPLLALTLYRRAAAAPMRPHGAGETSPALLLPIGVLAIQVLGVAAHFATGASSSPLVEELTWPLAGGLLLGAAVLAAGAWRTRTEWLAHLAIAELVLCFLVATGALGELPWRPAGVLSAAAALAALTVALRFLPSPDGKLGVFHRPLALSSAALAVIVLVWGAAFLPESSYRAAAAREGVFLAVAGVLTAAGVRLVATRLESCARDVLTVAGTAAGLCLGLAAFGLMDSLGARPDLYPLGLLAAAGAALAWAGTNARLRTSVPVLLSFALIAAFAVSFAGKGEPWGLVASFVLLAVAGRIAAARLPEFGSLVLLLCVGGGVSLAAADRLFDIDPGWQPAILLFFAAAALAAPRVPGLAVHRIVADWVAGPIIALGATAFAILAVRMLMQQPAVTAVVPRYGAVALGAGALLLCGASLSLRAKGIWRRYGVVVAALLAVFAVAPLNAWIEGGFFRYWRPDIEVGVLAVIFALLVPRDPRGKLAEPLSAAYALAGFAIALTALDHRHISTPLAVAAATLVPLVLLVRDRRGWHADVFGHGVILTAFAITVCAVPDSGRPKAEILTLLSLVSAVVSLLLATAGARFGRTNTERSAEAGAGLTRAAVTAGILSVICLVANTALLGHLEAGGLLVGFSVLAMALVAAVTLRIALATKRPWLVHVTVGSLLVLYGFLAIRTGILDMIEGYHAHALLLLGAGLLALGELRGGLLKPHLTADGLLLTAPAVLLSLPAVLGSGYFLDRAAFALFLAAATYGIAAFRTQSPVLGGLSVALLNLALFAFWRQRGIVDPAFYGVPAGLTLLVGAEALRGKVTAAAHTAMFVPGVALLYGSVGIQVLRVEEPTHALVLFGLGLATVTVGFLRDSSRLLVAGTAVVVLNVLAYLVRHGFEESFLGAALLVTAGLTVLTVATLAARRRKGRPGPRE